MSKKMSQDRAGLEIANEWFDAKKLFLAVAVVVFMMVPAFAQDGYPGGHEISGYVTYGVYGLSGVWITAVGTGDSTGYLGFDVTDISGYYNLPVPDGFAGNVEASRSGYTFDPSSRNYSNVISDMKYQNYAASNGSPPPPPPSIIVTSPNGGENWQRGTSHEITWNSTGSAGSYVKIELYKDGVLNLMITGSTANDGSYDWPVPLDQAPGSDYKIKITSTANSSYYDYGDNNFSVTAPPHIAVLSPNGGESRQRGTSYAITWDSLGSAGSYVRIELYKAGVLNLKIISSTANDGSYDWPVPSDQALGSDYKIKIASTSEPALFDESDGDFSIDEVSRILFEDTFGSIQIDPAKWIVISGAKVDNMGIEEPSPEYSLRLDGHPSGGDLIESAVIDLSPYTGATLTYSYERTGSGNSPEQGEDLVIEYYDGFGWVELDRLPGDGPDMENYDQVTIPLPPEAFHAGFSFRFRNTGTMHVSRRYDDWFVDDVMIEAAGGDGDDDDITYPVKLVADDGDSGDLFGRTVSISGKYAIAGSLRDNGDRGSAYVFERSAADWIQQARLTASSPGAGDQFGCSVSISGDIAIVGADRNNSNGLWSGAAYIFERTDTGWTQQEMLIPSDGRIGDRFGCAASIDGDYAIVGSYWDDDNANNSGSAYVFRKDPAGWVQEAKLTASDGAKDDWFGYAVSISGKYAVVGAVLDDDNGVNKGSVYVFSRSGSNWTQQAKLVAGDGNANDEFGGSVCIEGNYVIVGAVGNDGLGENSGAAYIFVRTGNDWIQQARLLAQDGADGENFGNSVSIDGTYAVIAANLDADMGQDSGSAYVFKREGQNWAQQAKLAAPDGQPYDYFGQAVSIDGSYVVIGAPDDDDNGENSGSAYIFRRIGTAWIP